MATTVLHQKLQPLTQALQRQFGDNLVALILFGSRARGDYQPGSDWDLLLIARQLPERTFQRHLTVKTSLPVEWRGKVSILAKTPAEFEDRLPPLYLDIALDGIILYDTEGYMHQRLARLRRVIHEQGLYREQQGRDLIWRWETFPGPDWQVSWESVPSVEGVA